MSNGNHPATKTAPSDSLPATPLMTIRAGEFPPGSRGRWGVTRCALFRFGFIYFVLYFLPFPVTALGSLGLLGSGGGALTAPFRWIAQGVFWFSGWFEGITQEAVKWFGYNVLRLKEGAIIIQPTGSGDTMLNYVQSALFVALAGIGTLVWSVADRRGLAHRRLPWVFRTYVRFALGTIVLGYGLAKVPPSQFRPPSPDWLVQSFGDSTPMRLLWTFMGVSPAYTMFAGFCEILGGLLLMFRRTATLGGLVTAGVMLNVAALNFCYDVPVKLFSAHLLLASLLVAGPDLGRLANVLLLNRPAAPSPAARRFAARWKNRTVLGLEIAFIVLLLAPGVYGTIVGWNTRGMNAPKPPLYGLYEVESFEVNGEARPPLMTDDTRWRRFIVTRWGSKGDPSKGLGDTWTTTAVVLSVSDKKEWIGLTFEGDHPTSVELKPRTPGAPAAGSGFKLSWTEEEPGSAGKVILEGEYKGDALKVTMRRKPDSEFKLYKRGFNWIQEMPVNQ